MNIQDQKRQGIYSGNAGTIKNDDSLLAAIDRRLEKERAINAKAKEFMKSAPEGWLCSEVRNGKYYYRQKWAMTVVDKTGKKRVEKSRYLPASRHATTRKLGIKRYYSTILKITDSNIPLLEEFLKKYTPNAEAIALESMTEAQRLLLKEELGPREKWMRDWMYAPYPHNEYYADEYVVDTLSGIKVARVGEARIADTLFTAGFAFRYNVPLTVNGRTKYPDFVILLPWSTEDHLYFLIWEHCGMMENEQYRKNHMGKFYLYAENGILPGVNCIFTYADRNHPLSLAQINAEIDRIYSISAGTPIYATGSGFRLCQ